MANKERFATDFMQLKEVFADIFNFFLYGGKEKILPQQLHEKSTEILDIRKSSAVKKQSMQQSSDLLCLLSMEDDLHSYLLLGIGNPAPVHSVLPIRSMLYSALQYRDQIKWITKQKRIEQQHAAEHVETFNTAPQSSSKLSDVLPKEDFLRPVITLVIYLGTEPWKYPRSVHQMLTDAPLELLEYLPDYQLHLIEPASLSDEQLMKFQSNLREILLCFKHANDKERFHTILRDPRFTAMQYEAAVLLTEFADLKLNLDENQKGGTIDMFSAFEQIKEDCKREGQTLGNFEARLAAVKALLNNLNLDVDAAMKALDIPTEQQDLIRKQFTPVS